MTACMIVFDKIMQFYIDFHVEADITSFLKMYFTTVDIFLTNWWVSIYWGTYICNPVYITGLMVRQSVYGYETGCLCGEYLVLLNVTQESIIYAFFL